MELWTEYEGVTLDGAFPLRKLLMPEGRSAFFSTAGTKGEPTVVRLIECHFDEEEILARWRSLEALNHPNFLKFERYGQTEVDGRPVVYAVFETVDGNLAEVLDQGHLEVKDVAQLASSMVAALEVLHTHGFIHEHIEPRNIFAVGSVVKLRGDCIREAPEGEEGQAAKRRDVHDMAKVLLQGLTQRQSLAGVSDAAIPAPFGHVIRNGLDGTWGLEKIRSVVDEHFGVKPAAKPESVSATAAATPANGQKAATDTGKKAAVAKAQMALPLDRKETLGRKNTIGRGEIPGRGHVVVPGGTISGAEDEGRGFSLRSGWVGPAVAAFVLLVFTVILAYAWHAHRQKAVQNTTATQAVAPSAATPEGSGVNAATSQPSSTVLPRASVAAAAPVAQAGWRVIAYTYDRRADAEKKASDLAHTHPELQPVVFSPRGRAPFLVSVGGVMDRNQAYALARKSRSLGLPRDSYAQNYR